MPLGPPSLSRKLEISWAARNIPSILCFLRRDQMSLGVDRSQALSHAFLARFWWTQRDGPPPGICFIRKCAWPHLECSFCGVFLSGRWEISRIFKGQHPQGSLPISECSPLSSAWKRRRTSSGRNSCCPELLSPRCGRIHPRSLTGPCQTPLSALQLFWHF